MQTKRLVETNLCWIIAYSVLRVKWEFPPLSKAGVVEFIGGVRYIYAALFSVQELRGIIGCALIE